MPLDTTKAGKLLAMLGSDHDGEALAALRKLSALLKAGGETFTILAKRLGLPKLAKPMLKAATADGEAAKQALAEVRKLVKAAGLDFTALAQRMTEPEKVGKTPDSSKADAWRAAGFDFYDMSNPADVERYARQERQRRATTRARRAAEREAIIARYGSEEAAAEVERERLLRAATAHMVKTLRKKFSNGVFPVSSLDGWTDDIGETIPETVRAAVMAAYPAPSSVAEACDEWGWWEVRWSECDLVLGDGCGDWSFDLACEARRRLITEMVEKDAIMPARTSADILARLRYAVDDEIGVDRDMLPGILAAFERVVMPGAQTGHRDNAPEAVPSEHPARASDRRARVIALLSDPSTAGLPDREVARRCGVSPSTVGVLRRRVQPEQPTQMEAAE